MSTASIGAGTLNIHMLSLDPGHPETQAIRSSPYVLHSMLVRHGASYQRSGGGRTLFLILPRSSGPTRVVIQSDVETRLDRLIAELPVIESSVEEFNLGAFEEGSLVRFDVEATARRHVGVREWKGRSMGPEDPDFRRYCGFVGLDDREVKSLRRVGKTWSWELHDGSTGSIRERSGFVYLRDWEACRSWFMERAFAVTEGSGRLTGEVSVDFLDVDAYRLRHAYFDRTHIPYRLYSGIVTVRNPMAFRERIASGIGSYKHIGRGLVRARLI